LLTLSGTAPRSACGSRLTAALSRHSVPLIESALERFEVSKPLGSVM
jgi:hypothetical protein